MEGEKDDGRPVPVDEVEDQVWSDLVWLDVDAGGAVGALQHPGEPADVEHPGATEDRTSRVLLVDQVADGRFGDPGNRSSSPNGMMG